MSPLPAHRALFTLACTLFLSAGLPLFGQASIEGRRFAILVGINQYSDSGLVALQKAQNDAEDLGTSLSRLGGYRSVTVMSGGLPYSDINFPSKNKIVDRVASLADIVKSEDQVLFFFSGHGVNDSSGASYILPIDAQIKDPTGTGIDLQNDIIGPLQRAGVKNIVCLIDACQKTVARDKGIAIVGVNDFKAGSRAVVITATGKGRASYEDPAGANGLFTRGILAALAGEGDLNRDGALSVSELERFLPDTVSEYAFNAGLSQKPSVFDSGSGSLQPVLARFAASQATASAAAGNSGAAVAASATPTAKAQFVTFKVPEGVRVDLRLLGADGREIKAWSDSASFSDKIEPGLYRVEAQDRSYLYYPYSASITVGATKVAVSLDLKPHFGGLSLSCGPADGVEVLLNGEKRGTLSGATLSVDRLKSGSYELVLSKELYDTKRQNIQIEDGKLAQVKLVLSPNFFTLALSEKNNMAATLYVDGQNKGSLPATLRLPFRSVALRVVSADSRYKEWSEIVQPGAKGGVEKRVAVFVGRTGMLEVTTDPEAEAELTLTPSGGGAALRIGTAPLDYEALIGDYELSAKAIVGGRRFAASAKVSLREGQTSPLRLELKDAAPAALVQSQAQSAPPPPQAPAAPSAPVVPSAQIAPAGFVLVPGGTFTMGSPSGEAGRYDDEVLHQVTLSAFYIGASEVTQAQYKAAMGTNPSSFKGDDLPVDSVSWNDAVAYCNKLSEKKGLAKVYSIIGTSVSADWKANGYRLPTEAEWEYAAKGGPSSLSLAVNAVFAGSADANDVAWYAGNSGDKTHPSGQKQANALGIYDMAGNVREWCWDWYSVYSRGAQIDPTGASSGGIRVIRGGSWASVVQALRSAYRGNSDPGGRDYFLGFRLARRAVR